LEAFKRALQKKLQVINQYESISEFRSNFGEKI